MLPGGLRRFVPCSLGANHCRLRHIGWEKCGHGLTSRPRESASELFFDELLGLFRYPPRSGRALLAVTLPLRYCAARFACKTPTWRLPVSGHVARLVAIYCETAGDSGNEVSSSGVRWVSGSGPGRKSDSFVSLSSTRLEEVSSCGLFMYFHAPDHTRRRCDQAHEGSTSAQNRIGVC